MLVNERPQMVGRGSPAPRGREDAPEEEKKRHRLSVVGVQSIACAVALLLTLLLRFAGGSAYEQLRHSFQEHLMRNDLLAALATLWDGDPLEGATSDPADLPETDTSDSDTEAVPESSPTAGLSLPQGTLAVPLRVTIPACPPVATGRLTSTYGYRENPTGEGTQFHRGVDIAVPAGTTIAAMYGGRVAQVGESDSLGRFVRINHGDGVEVLYAHCSQVLVAENTAVRAGERVALVGNTGDSTGAHVHVQVSCDGVVYDPSAMVAVTRYA